MKDRIDQARWLAVLVATAIAHATWTSVTYDELRYRLPEEPAAESRSLVATAHEPVAAVR